MKYGSTGEPGQFLAVSSDSDGGLMISSAGIGRTGAFLALSSILLPPKPPLPSDKSPLGPLPEEIREDRVAGTIDQMREYRGMLVQTEEQMQLVYDLTS